MPFVVLDGSLVFLRRGPGRKRASIAAMASLLLAGVQPIFARRELADHGVSAGSVSTKQSILWGKVPLPVGRFERQAIALRKTNHSVRAGSLA